MKREFYLGVRDGDLDGQRYARHWNPVMQPLQAQLADALGDHEARSGLLDAAGR